MTRPLVIPLLKQDWLCLIKWGLHHLLNKRANVDHNQNYTTYSVDNDSVLLKVTRKLLKQMEQIPLHSMIVKTHLKKLFWSSFMSLCPLYIERQRKLQLQVLRLKSIHHRISTQNCCWSQQEKKSCHKTEFLNEQAELHCTLLDVFSILLFHMSKAQEIWRWQIHSVISCCFNCLLVKMV